MGKRPKLLRRNHRTANSPLPTASGLGLAGLFFPLLQPMFWMGCHPAIRQQGFQGGGVIGGDGWNPTQHVG